MNKHYILFIGALILCLLTSCRKDIDETTIVTEVPLPIITIEARFNGFVSDHEGNVLESAAVWLGNDFVLTDKNGYYDISGIVNEKGTYIKVEADGFFDGYANVLPSKEEVKQVRFSLLERNLLERFSSNSNQLVQIQNNTTVELTANSYVDESGTLYEGEVNLFASYLDPTAANFDELLPGDLSALSTNGEEVILQSFGMVHIELEGANGQKLNINQPAKISVDVPQLLSSQAPDIIPLWYFDDTNGIWIEEGMASLIGNHYEGEVNHFTLWNCDIPNTFVTLEGTINTFDAQSKAIASEAGIKVCVTWIEGNQTVCTLTDAMGNFSGKVPDNANLKIDIYSRCGQIIFSDEIGPYTSNAKETFDVTLDDDFVSFNGSILDCNGAPVSSGYAIFSFDNGINVYSNSDENGQFNTTINKCFANQVDIEVVDINESTFTTLFSRNLDMTNIDLGELTACENEIVNVVQFLSNDENYHFIDVKVEKYFVFVEPERKDSTLAYNFTYTDLVSSESYTIYSMDLVFIDALEPLWLGTISASVYNNTRTLFINGCFDYDSDNEIDECTFMPVSLGENPGEIVEFHIDPAVMNVEIEGQADRTIEGTAILRAVLEE